MAINETLKFSWGHIIAFLAIIFISYLSFMGLTYLTDGNFLIAGAGVAIIDLLLLSTFMGIQVLKATEKKFKRRIIAERLILIISPIIFAACFIPQAHFWSVFDQRGEIESQFKTSIEQSKEMFSSYEKYVDNRIIAYKKRISQSDKNAFSRTNKIEALTLQLKSDNYIGLKTEAIEWIDKASGATVWNVFMIANIKTITEAVESWNSQLVEMSAKIMSDEKSQVFDSDSSVVKTVKEGLSTLNDIYSVKKSNKLYTWFIMFFLYVMLAFPYLIQDRHTKSLYTLLGKRKFGSSTSNSRNRKGVVKGSSEEDELETDTQSGNIEDIESSDEDDYGSFTI